MQELSISILGQTILGSYIIMAIVQKIKDWLHTSGTLNTVIAFVVGGLLGLVGKILGIVTPIDISLFMAIIQGLFSGLVATGGYLLLKKLTK